MRTESVNVEMAVRILTTRGYEFTEWRDFAVCARKKVQTSYQIWTFLRRHCTNSAFCFQTNFCRVGRICMESVISAPLSTDKNDILWKFFYLHIPISGPRYASRPFSQSFSSSCRRTRRTLVSHEVSWLWDSRLFEVSFYPISFHTSSDNGFKFIAFEVILEINIRIGFQRSNNAVS